MIVGVPYWRLSAFYFFYFALVGALSPFLSLYLTDIGFTAQAIGGVNAVIMGTKIIAPNIWGWLCDYTGKRLRIISIGSFGAMMCFAGWFLWQSLLPIMIVTFVYSFFWNAILSQFDTLTIQYLEKKSDRYSHVRLWGSVGFIVSVVILGWLFDHISIQNLIPIAWCLMVLIWLSTLLFKEPPQKEVTVNNAHWLAVLKKPAVVAFFIAVFLLQFSFGAYYSFFSLHLESYGYSRSSIGLLWGLGVISEVVIFIYMHKLFQLSNVSFILFISLFLTAIRWLLIAFFADKVIVIIMAQTLHAFSFGAAHAACIELVRVFFKGSSAGQGQALYSSITFGLGGALGALISGALWDMSHQLVFFVASMVVFISAIIVYFGVNKDKIVDEDFTIA